MERKYRDIYVYFNFFCFMKVYNWKTLDRVEIQENKNVKSIQKHSAQNVLFMGILNAKQAK